MQILGEKIETREPLTFESNGQKIFAVLHRPLEVENCPLVCIFHGFASSKLGSNRSYVYLAEAFSRAKIATLRFDFRGSGDSEGTISDFSFEDLIADAKSLYDFLPSIEGIDSERIGIFGSSLGGSIAILSQKYAPKVKAMVLWAPVASGKLWFYDYIQQNPELKPGNPALTFEVFRGMKINPLFREEYGKMNAAASFNDLNFPVLHMHGALDKTISLAHQEAFRAQAPKNASFVTYPNVEHHLAHTNILPEVMEESTSWFKKYL